MKYSLFTALLLFSLQLSAQKGITVPQADPAHMVQPGMATVYGSFMPRHQTWLKKGYQHYVYIKNLQSGELFLVETLHYFNNGKEGVFCCHLKPGTYELLSYKWGDAQVYGVKVHTEPIYENIDATDSLEAKVKSGAIKIADLKRFTFRVSEDTLYYLGSWNFNTGIAVFTDKKALADRQIKTDFLTVDFNKAITVIPR